MPEELIVNYAPYHASSVKPRGFMEFCDMVDTQGRITGIWEFVQWDPQTGEVRKRVWNKNVVTDNGAVNILASAIAAASNASPWSNILITNNSASTNITTATGTSATTSLIVGSLPAALPANSSLVVGYGTGTTQTIPGPTGVTSQGTSGTLTVPSWTPTINFPIGTAVVPAPAFSDNPSNANLTANATTPVSAYSSASGGVCTFTYSATPGGAGGRSVVVSFVFKNTTNSGQASNGSYTDAWLVNVTSGATNTTTGLFVGNYVAHEINVPMRVDNNNNCTATVTVKI